MTIYHTNGDPCSIEVHNDYPWIGSEKYGRFRVYIDGNYRCSVPPMSSMQIDLDGSCEHTFQVRFWYWFRSPVVMINLATKPIRIIRVNLPMNRPFMERMKTLFAQPRSALRVELEK